jgi:hypothetical protein
MACQGRRACHARLAGSVPLVTCNAMQCLATVYLHPLHRHRMSSLMLSHRKTCFTLQVTSQAVRLAHACKCAEAFVTLARWQHGLRRL